MKKLVTWALGLIVFSPAIALWIYLGADIIRREPAMIPIILGVAVWFVALIVWARRMG